MSWVIKIGYGCDRLRQMQILAIKAWRTLFILLEHSKKIGIIIETALICDGIQWQIRMKEFLGQHHAAKQDIVIYATACVLQECMRDI